jgi:hypothetical protein
MIDKPSSCRMMRTAPCLVSDEGLGLEIGIRLEIGIKIEIGGAILERWRSDGTSAVVSKQ